MVLFCCAQAMAGIADSELMTGWTFWAEDNPQQTWTVSLPHDAQQQIARDKDVAGGHHSGYARPGVFHYTKTLHADKALTRKHVTLVFEGVYRNARLLVNGKEAARQDYGYLPMRACIDGLLRPGDNTLEVVADNSQVPNSRWYSGAGIYRPAHIIVQHAEAYIDDVKVSTLSIRPEARIRVEADCRIAGKATVECAVYLRDRLITAFTMPEDGRSDVVIPDARLWSAGDPTLYTLTVRLKKGRKVVDERTMKFGIRTLAWNAKEGFLVNGKPELLRGGCLHHDNGILGACEYDEAAIYRLSTLKQFGFNAIRSAHNPCSEAVLKACDSLGIYVMDELWDMWYTTKTKYDYSLQWKSNWQQDIDAMVRKDFSHPSVVMYSIGNELGEPHDSLGLDYERRVVERLHSLDVSRPATAGLNLMILVMAQMNISIYDTDLSGGAAKKPMTSEEYNAMMASSSEQMMKAVLNPAVDLVTDPACRLLDIAGYNYGQLRYDMDNEVHPDRILVGSETMPYDIAYNWERVEKYPQLIGDFQWTAWDYIGECALGAWYHTEDGGPINKNYPWLLADAGSFDLIGTPTGEAFWAKAVWSKSDRPYLCVQPLCEGKLVKGMWRGTNAIRSWSWRGMEGKEATVEVFTAAPRVQLWLNGSLVGEEAVEGCRAMFTLPYQPGTLKAVALSADGSSREDVLTTATGAPHIALHALPAVKEGSQLRYVDVCLEGDNGEVIPNADRLLTLRVEGGTLLGFGSAHPTTDCRFLSGTYTTYHGRAQAVILARPGCCVSVSGEGLDTQKIVVE